jgi:hypothetical protein
MPACDLADLVQQLTDQMHTAAADLQFERAARLGDEISELKKVLRQLVEATHAGRGACPASVTGRSRSTKRSIQQRNPTKGSCRPAIRSHDQHTRDLHHGGNRRCCRWGISPCQKAALGNQTPDLRITR